MPPPPPRRFAHAFQTIGPATADVTVEAFICLQCPFAKKAFFTLLNLLEALPERVRIIFRPFVFYPHVNSLLAAKAAFAASKQSPEKFIDFCKALFEHQDEFNKTAAVSHSQGELKEVFARIAGSFGLDTGSFLADIDSDAVMLDVKESQRHGILHCVWSTPTFVINGSEVPSLGSSTSPEDWTKYLTGLVA